MTTEERIHAWLANRVNRHAEKEWHTHNNWLTHMILRSHFTTTNGITISIQQGSTHYCDPDSVELWECPHHPILKPYGDGTSPYGYVPITVLAQYIDALEAG